MKVVFYSEEKAIKQTTSKLAANYASLQAPSKLENQLAGSGGDSRTGGHKELWLVTEDEARVPSTNRAAHS